MPRECAWLDYAAARERLKWDSIDQGGSRNGNGRAGTMATGMIVTGLLFCPAAPLWGLKKGKPAVLPAGQRYSVVVRNETPVRVAVESNQ